MRKRVLIAEDDYYIRKVLVEFFTRVNFEIVTINDGCEVSEFLTNNNVDLILIDFHLPGKNGDEIMEEMQNNNIDIPVIVVTADDSVETERKIRKYRPAFLFFKPFEVSVLREVLDGLFGKKGPSQNRKAVNTRKRNRVSSPSSRGSHV